MKKSLSHNELEKSDRILYTPASFAKLNLIYLQETGELKAKKNHISRRKSLKSYLFLIVINGTGKISYKNQDYIVKKGECVFLDCTNGYSHESIDDSWTLKWVHFYGENMQGIYEKYIQRGGKPCFKSKNFVEYDSLLDDIYSLAASDINVRDMKLYERLVSLVTMIMSDGFENDLQQTGETSARNLMPLKKYIDEHYNEKITLDFLAEKFYINKYYLTRLFKKQYGNSIVNYILQVRITHAKQLLRFTDMSIEYISEECGFSDTNYFSRAFRKIEGISPAKFRKMW